MLDSMENGRAPEVGVTRVAQEWTRMAQAIGMGEREVGVTRMAQRVAEWKSGSPSLYVGQGAHCYPLPLSCVILTTVCLPACLPAYPSIHLSLCQSITGIGS
jgi:hypothetical protein